MRVYVHCMLEESIGEGFVALYVRSLCRVGFRSTVARRFYR